VRCKKVIIYGLGPSLHKLPLRALLDKQYDHITTNLWYRCNLFPQTFSPTYWAFWDTARFRTALQEYFAQNQYQGTVIHWGDMYPLQSKKRHMHPEYIKSHETFHPFKEIGVRGGLTGQSIAAQMRGALLGYSTSNIAYGMAVYLGYHEIYLAGQDYIYNENTPEKFHAYTAIEDNQYLSKNPWIKKWPDVKDEFLRVKKVAEEYGVKTFNITPEKNNVFYSLFPGRKL